MVMKEEQKYLDIPESKLTETITGLNEKKARIVQIHCSKIKSADGKFTYELNYSFDLWQQPSSGSIRPSGVSAPDRFVTVRTVVDEGATLPSISWICPAAFLYENEIHDLYGINFKGITIDYKGNFYLVDKKFPQSGATSAEVSK